MSELVYPQDQPQFSLRSTPLLTVFAVLGMTVGLGLLYPSTLAGKTFTLLGLTMAGALVGAWNGRALRGAAYWGAAIGSIVAMFALYFIVDHLALPLLVVAMLAWGWLEGLVIGPALAAYVEVLGAETVSSAFGITAAVMAGCAAIATMTSFNGLALGRYLFWGLLALIGFSLVSMFRSFSAKVSKGYAMVGMALFTGFFLFDFARMKASDQNTWGQAARLAVSIYLDFVNFLLYLLHFLAMSRHH